MNSDGVREASEAVAAATAVSDASEADAAEAGPAASERLDTRAAAAELRADRRRERALGWKVLAVLIIVTCVAIARELWWVHG